MTPPRFPSADTFQGALLGLAVGDALGTTLEFQAPGFFAPIDDMTGGGPFRLQPGQWTDDTSMALCLATSLLENNGFDPKDQMQRYVRWMREGYLSSNGKCFDIGITVQSALWKFIETGEPYAGSTDPYTAGNGSLMRLAPVALFYFSQPRLAHEMAAESSRTTHGAKKAVDACRYFAGLMVGALQGRSKQEILSPQFSPEPGYWRENPLDPAIAEIAGGSFKNPKSVRGSGYVVESLEAALWAFHTTDNFREGCLRAANLGDDADTTAAIFGQLAGAYYGAEQIPWLERLAKRELIISLADQLHSLHASAHGS